MKIQKLEELEGEYIELEKKMYNPASLTPQDFTQITKRLNTLKPVIELYRKYKKISAEIESLEEMIKTEKDPELKKLAATEKEELESKREKLESELTDMTAEGSEYSNRDVIVELRAGTGGEEAALFVADLFKMYSKFAEKKGWKIEPLASNPTDIGGYKELIFSVKGKDVYKFLRYESGVHRVQRIPVTESGGRIHTSAASVAVLPEPEDIEVDLNPNDLKIDVFRSTGHGGQSVNTTDSAVRITHIPTGIVVTCQDERSQLKNKEKAMRILKARLLDKKQREQAQKLAQERKQQIGMGDRSEKIRTYNFPQNRVTDHRINFSLYRLQDVLDGEMDELIEKLILHFKEQ